jgi:tetratricopeptide (TPR) repeat protein
MEESLAGFKRHHGYAFYARGPHAFIVHGTVQEKSDTSGEALKAALSGLTLDADAKPALLVYFIAKQQAASPDDPRVLYEAGRIYLSGNEQQRMPKNLVLAERVLERAIKEAKPETYGPEQIWFLHESLGLATLEARKLDAAIGWLTKAEELAGKVTEGESGARNGQSCYNLACAYALSGKTDEAFGALDRCVAQGFLKDPRNIEHMKTNDPDLESLRKDPRWEKYFQPAEAK